MLIGLEVCKIGLLPILIFIVELHFSSARVLKRACTENKKSSLKIIISSSLPLLHSEKCFLHQHPSFLEVIHLSLIIFRAAISDFLSSNSLSNDIFKLLFCSDADRYIKIGFVD